ncbi:peptidase T [Pseudoroseicyclus sp. H15]
MPDFDKELEERLHRYCAIDSQSDYESTSEPSSEIQLDIQRLLVSELEEMGASDVQLTEYGTVLATIPGTGPTVGFLAHVDTTQQYNATGVKPRTIRRYNGGDITYPDNSDLVLSPSAFPYLAEKVGDDIVTASGDTLLGADDKAGVAIIMAAARHLLANPDLPRPTLRLAFTPDEEIGRGAHEKLPADLGAEFAYTFDGGALGEIEYETFSADGATVRIRGVSIHPGLSKGKMVNATTLAARLLSALPQATMTPETTDEREGFIHCTDMAGDSSQMVLRFILRDFELDGLEEKGRILTSFCEALQQAEPRAVIACEITPQYRNMRYWLEKDMTPVDLARDAAKDLGLEPSFSPIRGGTDGSRMTEMGVPCPNLFTGMQNIHGPLEYVSVQDMARATELMLAIAARAARS